MRLAATVCSGLFLLFAASLTAQEKINVAPSPATKYCRYLAGNQIHFGLVEGTKVRELEGSLFEKTTKTETVRELKDIVLLTPCEPRNVFALAGNYKSHLGGDDITTTVTTVTKVVVDPKTGVAKPDSKTTVDTQAAGSIPTKFQIPQPFLKSVSCLLPHGGDIVLPKDAGRVDYEAEMVIVIGKEARNVTEEKAKEYIFGVTIGNDVSARVWQKGDVQWWRAKGSDTFGPVGPFIATSINYDDLRLQLRQNGKTKQDERTSHMVHDCAALVSAISRSCTLHPGDLIFTGTSGTTDPLSPGDVIEIELEHVGVLVNNVVAEE
jgi:2-keto-4-pentenoate hydratase/2-oxohepta-3-ene-1,7-dioic acid hydratase in catechol pathway